MSHLETKVILLWASDLMTISFLRLSCCTYLQPCRPSISLHSSPFNPRFLPSKSQRYPLASLQIGFLRARRGMATNSNGLTNGGLKHGEFVGSLDCGTTWAIDLIFEINFSDLNIPQTILGQLVSSSLTNMQTSLLRNKSSFRSITLNLGMNIFYTWYYIWRVTHTFSWHEHDPDEIMETCEACIEGACNDLETAGWSKDSVKVIGLFPFVD